MKKMVCFFKTCSVLLLLAFIGVNIGRLQAQNMPDGNWKNEKG